jgi:hypothetical protein
MQALHHESLSGLHARAELPDVRLTVLGLYFKRGEDETGENKFHYYFFSSFFTSSFFMSLSQ